MDLILCIVWQISAKDWQLWAFITVLISETVLPTQFYHFVMKGWVRTATGQETLATSPEYYHCQQSTWPVGHMGSLQETSIYTPVRTLCTLSWRPKLPCGLYLRVFLRKRYGEISLAFFHGTSLSLTFFCIRKWQKVVKISQPDQKDVQWKSISSHLHTGEPQLNMPGLLLGCPENNGAQRARVLRLQPAAHTTCGRSPVCPVTAAHRAPWRYFLATATPSQPLSSRSSEGPLSFRRGHWPFSFLGLLASVI